jgi:hypothetical protein
MTREVLTVSIVMQQAGCRYPVKREEKERSTSYWLHVRPNDEAQRAFKIVLKSANLPFSIDLCVLTRRTKLNCGSQDFSVCCCSCEEDVDLMVTSCYYHNTILSVVFQKTKTTPNQHDKTLFAEAGPEGQHDRHQ